MDYTTWLLIHPELAEESEDYKKQCYAEYLSSIEDLYVDHN